MHGIGNSKPAPELILRENESSIFACFDCGIKLKILCTQLPTGRRRNRCCDKIFSLTVHVLEAANICRVRMILARNVISSSNPDSRAGISRKSSNSPPLSTNCIFAPTCTPVDTLSGFIFGSRMWKGRSCIGKFFYNPPPLPRASQPFFPKLKNINLINIRSDQCREFFFFKSSGMAPILNTF